jgi:adenylate cyclase
MRRRRGDSEATKPTRAVGVKSKKRSALPRVRKASDKNLQALLDQRTRELKEAQDQQAATTKVLKVISASAGELEPVFEAMLKNAVSICDASFRNLLLYDGNLFRHVALHNAPQAWAAERERDPVPPRDLALALYRVADTKRLSHIEDITIESPDEPIGTIAGARTLLLAPTPKQSELVGVIAIYRQHVRLFGDRQIALLQNFAAQAVIAISLPRAYRPSLARSTGPF